MIVYLAGKMTGLADYGRKKFYEAEQALIARGYAVLNPAWLPIDMRQEQYMPICLAMLEQADLVCVIDPDKRSMGMRLECDYAVYQKKPVWLLEAVLNGQFEQDAS